MKTRIMLTALLVLTIISAGFAINPQPEPPRQINLRLIETPPPVFDQTKLPVLQNKFVISPISALKLTLGNQTPTKVMSAKTQVPNANRMQGIFQAPPVTLVGNPYAKDKGVVLDALNPGDPATGSVLVVKNVMYSPNLTKQLAAHDPETSLAVTSPNEGSTPFAEAYFYKLAPGFHTYMLTLGTTAKPADIRMSISGQKMQGPQLIANPNTNEVRVFFTYDSSSYYGNYLQIIIWLTYDKPLPYSSYEYFHHLQLAQLD